MRFTLLGLAALSTSVLAGLEDARFSTVLSAENFNQELNAVSEGSLVAFFAPWCGHCKSLEPTWTKIAEAFEGDDRCRVAHFDADQSTNKGLASKYDVKGFPTIKFIPPPSSGKAAVDYQGQRSEAAFLQFLNEKCGTNREPGGGLSSIAGRIPSLDSLASRYFNPSPTADRSALLASASALASGLGGRTTSMAQYYLRVMDKYSSEASTSVDEAQAWVEKEIQRLGKLMNRKGAIVGRKLDEIKMKQNILAAFKYVETKAEEVVEAVQDGAEAVADKAEAVVDHIKGEL